MSTTVTAVLDLVGAALIVAGVAIISTPAAMIVAGLFTLAISRQAVRAAVSRPAPGVDA